MAFNKEKIKKLNTKLSNGFNMSVPELMRNEKVAKKAIKISEKEVNGVIVTEFMIFRIYFSTRRIESRTVKTNKTLSVNVSRLCLNVSRATSVADESIMTSHGLGFTFELKDVKRKMMTDINYISEKLTTDVCHNLSTMILALDELNNDYIHKSIGTSFIHEQEQQKQHIETYINANSNMYVHHVHYHDDKPTVTIEPVTVKVDNRNAENITITNVKTNSESNVPVMNGYIMATLTTPSQKQQESYVRALKLYTQSLFPNVVSKLEKGGN